ncbi:MAG: gliding motility lipoprotein GldD [Bacteroidetes bacterium 4572_114]|nr:MAG: gliding motility lipoprotein GldD [Bacteroidetes bacterium 4572_114]
MLLVSCGDDHYIPKPRGYFRINLPAHKYQTFDTIFPYKFEYPEYSKITFDEYTRSGPFWLNIEYPGYKGKIHLSYKTVGQTNLNNLIEDSRTMVYKHIPKATGIKESIVTDPQSKVFGTVYFIEGRDVASPFQFYVTDSTHHFLRGALYFYTAPNNDSLQPVIDFIIDDIDHLIGTLEWKDI